MKKLVPLLILLGVAASIHGETRKSNLQEKPDWGKHFKAEDVQGCFLLYDLQRNRYLAYDPKRVGTEFLPASTFKFFNSLVALETGAVRDEAEVLEWDGVERMVPAWNYDTDMRSAFKNSTVWFYQEMARRIGRERMRRYVNKAGYGNRSIGGRIDSFWLNGNLRTTAKEQVDFLVKLHRNRLPFSPRVVRVVKDMSVDEKTGQYILRAKTGWAGLGDKSVPQVGW